ncbi:homeobox-leucine zipper family protein [Hibiscus syriacus]|uniref:Homeobox-leucine zipper family protein n=1 Tax=Hibiscus syriacus TaxID=106335 RepID=A0A6A2WPI3_HIBSY|nr:homeobox-leucine zipper family protein [Hibiscus syriacus]
MDPPLSPGTDSIPFKKETWKHTILLSFQSLGVVYGRLSTAPLYVFTSIPTQEFKSDESAYEYFSFIFWTLTIIPLVKYAIIVLRADDDGEGGTFALYSLLCRHGKVGLLPNNNSDNNVMQYDYESPSVNKVELRARRAIVKHKSSHYLMLFLALLGSCMIIADAVLTPAISGLINLFKFSSFVIVFLIEWYVVFMFPFFFSSASFSGFIQIFDVSVVLLFISDVPVPVACAILVCLFTVQRYGSRRVGLIFAPIVIVWLLVISGMGVYNILHYDTHIMYAISPKYIYRYLKSISLRSWRSLGSLTLCVAGQHRLIIWFTIEHSKIASCIISFQTTYATCFLFAGSEAMYADLGHFSVKSIKMTFFCVIYPVLIVCYAGQAAFLSHTLSAKNSPGLPDEYNHLFRSVPDHFQHVYTVLALFASVIGSQATITACFSIVNQCLALGCFPRVKVIHTSDTIHGQVYIPDLNWIVMVLSLSVTIGFHDAPRIGNALGTAVVSSMLVTTFLMSLVIALYWEKSLLVSACFLLFFGSIEALYLSCNILNFHKGTWYLAVLLVLSLTIMVSWHYGTLKKYQFDLENKVSTEWLMELNSGLGVSRVPGIGLVYTDIVTGIPAFFSHFITNVPAFHQVLIFVSFKSLTESFVPPSRRYLIGRVGPRANRIYRCIVRYGYRDHIRDTGDFEEQIIRSIGDFISMEECDAESLVAPEGKMIVVGKQAEGDGLIPLHDNHGTSSANAATQTNGSSTGDAKGKKKKVRFMLPVNTPRMRVSVREELNELIEARESGTAYFLGQSHLVVRNGSNFLKRFLIMVYVFLDKNGREPHVALNIPHAALVEVGMVYTI